LDSKISICQFLTQILQINHQTDFVAEGCKVEAQSAITYGAGTQFQDINEFAGEHNLSIVGGFDQSVGAAGRLGPGTPFLQIGPPSRFDSISSLFRVADTMGANRTVCSFSRTQKLSNLSFYSFNTKLLHLTACFAL